MPSRSCSSRCSPRAPAAAAEAPPDTAAALERVRASAQNVAAFLAARDTDIDELYGAAPLSFIASEQALLLGHPVHPTPKSRTEMSPADVAAYSPELGAHFALHWLAVDAAVVEHDSAAGTPVPELAARLLRDRPDGRRRRARRWRASASACSCRRTRT
jgi:siderophore synthetase component